jgi:hypothetical protein
MNRKARCCLVTVAASEHCEVSRCEECGNVQLHVGPMAVRLPVHVFEDMVHCLHIALEQIHKVIVPDNRGTKSVIREFKH